MVAFFSAADEKKIVAAIREAEKQTSGEVRVHLAPGLKGRPVLEAATRTFHKLGMDKTDARNGVLFFIAPDDKQFAVIGDKGIDEAVPPDFWEDVKDLLQGFFTQGQFLEGLVQGIARVGEKLKAYFPYQTDDQNELPDDISYG